MVRQGHYCDSFSFSDRSDESWTRLGSERDTESESARYSGMREYLTRNGRSPRGGENGTPASEGSTYEDPKKGERDQSMLKKARKANRSQKQYDNKRKVDDQSSCTAHSWHARRELDGRASPKTQRVQQAQDEGWTEEEWKQWREDWYQHEWEMANHQRQMGEDTHVTVWKDCRDETWQAYNSTHAVVTNEECKAMFDPPDQPNEKKTNIEKLQAAGAAVVHEDSPEQPHTVSDLGTIPLEEFAGSLAKHTYGLAGNSCKTCKGEITLASGFACFKQTVRNGKYEFEMIVDDDAALSKVKGLPFKNLSSAKGWLGPDDGEVTIAHVCVHCAERLAHAPEAFSEGQIDVESPLFHNYPRIHHCAATEGGGWCLNRKWKRAAARSIGPPSNTERSKNIRHIVEGIVRKAERGGGSTRSVDEMMKQFSEEDQKRIAKGSDWVAQITPNTGQDQGCCIMYAHNCDMEMIRKLQGHVPESTLKTIKEQALVAPIRSCHWWLTVGHQFLENRVHDWGVTVEAGVAKWLCPICGDTYCPFTDLRNRVLTLANMQGLEDSKMPACVIARLGDFDLNQKIDYNGWPNINIQVFIDTLKKGVLLQELEGRRVCGTTAILDAVGRLHEKAHTFHKNHFQDKIVMFKACDFRMNHKAPDRSGRIALCEDRRLSLQHVGQDVPALFLDMDEIKPLDRSELIDILITLSTFYDLSPEGTKTKAQKPIFHMLEKEGGKRREQVTKSMDAVGLARSSTEPSG